MPRLFMVHKKFLNDNWTKTGSCEPTFTKLSYKRVPIKLIDGLFYINPILCPFKANYIYEGINQETLYCLGVFFSLKVSFEWK